MSPKYNKARWTTQEETLIVKMREESGASWDAIAEKLGRKAHIVEARYKKIKDQEKIPENFFWGDESDGKIIEGRKYGKPFREIAAELGLPLGIVQERGVVLRRQGRIPKQVAKAANADKSDAGPSSEKVFTPASPIARKDSVVEASNTAVKEVAAVEDDAARDQNANSEQTAIPKDVAVSRPTARKIVEKKVAQKAETQPVIWAEEEDEFICRLYLGLVDIRDLFQVAKPRLNGKTKAATEQRMRWHLRGEGPKVKSSEIYLKLMGGQGASPWSKEDVLRGNYKVGEWKTWRSIREG